MSTNVIEFEQFFFGYEKNAVLHDISFSISAGEYVSIIGPNGAGKSTLLKRINRIVKGGQGTVKLFGKDLSHYRQKELGRLIGYVSQNREQQFPYTVYEFVFMGRYPYLHPLSRMTKEDKKAIDEALFLTGTTSLAQRPVSTLSGGERQKVYIAGALAQQPKILLLDEPTTHLDPKYQVEIQKTISEICSKMGMTVLHVTHDLNNIFFWSQRIVALKQGRIKLNGKPQEVLTGHNLQSIFETEFLFVTHPLTNQQLILPKIQP